MTSAGGRSSDDDATKVIFNKAGRVDETVIVPADRAGGSVSGKMVGTADQQSPHPSAAGDKTTFILSDSKEADPNFNPVVGWVVVVEGPGRGVALQVYYGQNAIGRGAELRIRLDFGDARISREAHAFLVYDEVQRKFFLKDNGKSSVVRLNGSIVLAPTQVQDRDLITIGQTTLLFVALCGVGFDWLADNAARAT